MIDPEVFSRRQMELRAEFAKYVIEHPEVDDSLPDDTCVLFEVEGEPEFNEYSRQLAERRQREDGVQVVCIQIRGPAPP